MGGVGVVFHEPADDPGFGERLELRLERVGRRLVINFSAIDVEGEGLKILLLLHRVLDRRLRPGVERKLLDAVLLGGGDIFREGVVLALRHGAIPRQHCDERRQRRLDLPVGQRLRLLSVDEIEADLIAKARLLRDPGAGLPGYSGPRRRNYGDIPDRVCKEPLEIGEPGTNGISHLLQRLEDRLGACLSNRIFEASMPHVVHATP